MVGLSAALKAGGLTLRRRCRDHPYLRKAFLGSRFGWLILLMIEILQDLIYQNLRMNGRYYMWGHGRCIVSIVLPGSGIAALASMKRQYPPTTDTEP